MKIDSEYLSHLHFANDLHIMTTPPHELQQMLQELAENENQVLKMNKSKTKVTMETDTPIYVNNTLIEIVDGKHQRQKPRKRDSKKNHGRMDNIRQAP